jgi:hypothetical protein
MTTTTTTAQRTVALQANSINEIFEMLRKNQTPSSAELSALRDRLLRLEAELDE